ncbi:hypothetical protein [uncultured Microscilla sp.]|uniref:hypothetical protein n=1 Tax=uncultured Microscilla sp. TaxID=432653 RepID=UPI0026234512|nr:hypothetical protein [uncultured Microscilla sp.]
MSAQTTKNARIPTGFCYVPQDHYYIASLLQPHLVRYLYSDGATSCIIAIVTGKNQQGVPITVLSHLSKPVCVEAFFDVVTHQFKGEMQLFAQGANAQHQEAIDTNTQTIIDLFKAWVAQRSLASADGYIYKAHLWFNTGNPLEQNRDCLGIDLATRQVSHQRFDLTEDQRDITGGLQTLASIFGAELSPPIVLRVANAPFTHAQVKQLLFLALHYQWLDILTMKDEEILHYFSSTPHCEVSWFCDALRQSAQYVQTHLHLVL